LETIIVEITIGALNEVVQFMLPAHVAVRQLMADITRQICRLFPNVDYDSGAMLYSLDAMTPIQPEWTLAANNVQDGSSLMLM